MATPTLRALREGIPQLTEMCLVGRPGPVSVLEGLPWHDSSLCFKPRSKSKALLSRRGVVGALRSRSFDAMVLFPNSIGSALIAYLSGIPRRIGYESDGRSWLLTDRLPRYQGNIDYRNLSCIEYYLRLAQYLGCPSTDRQMEIALQASDLEDANDLWQKFGFEDHVPTVMFNTSSASAPSRLWPIEQTIRSARTLAREHGLQVIVHCGPADRERANAIEHGADHPKVRSMGTCHDLPLGLSKGVMVKSALVVTTDSGPRHMAAALNRPVIGLYGPTDPTKNGTFNIPETVLNAKLACQPCAKHQCPLVHNNCMHSLNYRLVTNAIVQRLSEIAQPEAVAVGSSTIPRIAA